jgi:hypothetical protein
MLRKKYTHKNQLQRLIPITGLLQMLGLSPDAGVEVCSLPTRAPPVRAPHTALLPRKRCRPQRDGLECDARIFFEVRVRKLLGDFFFWRRMVRPTAPPSGFYECGEGSLMSLSHILFLSCIGMSPSYMFKLEP